MRTLLYVSASLVLIGFAFWAYRVNYETQGAAARLAKLQNEITAEREALGVLGAEWAYLNRPDRLRDLAELYFPDLGLAPLNAEHFAEAAIVAFPPPAPEPGSIEAIIAASIAAEGAP